LVPPSTDDALPIEVPPAELDEGPHLGYAVQWFAFAGIALFGFFFVLLGGPTRPRSRTAVG
jgi:surfeit locus 1 family protein